MVTEPETYQTVKGLLEIIGEKFKSQHNEACYWKLVKQYDKREEEQMGCLRVKTTECNYKERDRRQKEQFINGIDDQAMMVKIIKELTAKKDTKEVASKEYQHGKMGRSTKVPESHAQKSRGLERV